MDHKDIEPDMPEIEESAASTKSIFSKRAQTRFAELQHRLNLETQTLSTLHSHFLGALLACDVKTQRSMMLAYRDQLHEVHSIVSKLCVTLDRQSREVQD